MVNKELSRSIPIVADIDKMSSPHVREREKGRGRHGDTGTRRWGSRIE
jgi:hypothetical protein